METSLTFDYDDVGDILYIRKVLSYAEQVTDQLAFNVFARRNPETEAIEGLEILFFTRWLQKEGLPPMKNLRELFELPAPVTHA